MYRWTAGAWTGEWEGRQPWEGVVGGIVERMVCEVFMVCDLNLVGRLGIGYTTLVELCVKERGVRRTSSPKSQWNGPGDGMQDDH